MSGNNRLVELCLYSFFRQFCSPNSPSSSKFNYSLFTKTSCFLESIPKFSSQVGFWNLMEIYITDCENTFQLLYPILTFYILLQYPKLFRNMSILIEPENKHILFSLFRHFKFYIKSNNLT